MDDTARERPVADPYRGLILDFGGVLTTQMHLNSKAFEQSEGLEPGAYVAALEEHPDGIAVYAALEVGGATQEDWNRVVGGILGVDPTDLMRRALANLHPEPLIVAAAQRARAAGIKVALLSNSFGLAPYHPYADRGLWTDFFNAVVVSELEGVRKPSPVIYERVLPHSTCPARIVYTSMMWPRTWHLPTIWASGPCTTPRTRRPRRTSWIRFFRLGRPNDQKTSSGCARNRFCEHGWL
jgi:putative hydrolase of the HAD superfamily